MRKNMKSGEQMSIDDYLGRLTLEQLFCAKGTAERLITAKKSEKRVTIYRVCADSSCESNNLTWNDAVKSFICVANALAAKDEGYLPYQLSITSEEIVESEVREYCPGYVPANDTLRGSPEAQRKEIP